MYGMACFSVRQSVNRFQCSLSRGFVTSFQHCYIRQNLAEGNQFNYEELYKDFKWSVPEYFNFTGDVIDKFADQTAEKVGLWFVHGDSTEEKFTYRDLSEASGRGGNVFKSLGVKSALCILPRIPEWWIINLASIRQDVILLPGTTQLQENDILHRLKASQADCIIADSETATKFENISKGVNIKTKILVGHPGERKEGWINWNEAFASEDSSHSPAKTHKDAISQVFFTSGTVGSPKMVPHTHSSYGCCHHVTGKYWLDLMADDIHWNISDPGWAKSAWSSVYGPFSQGCTVFVHGMPRFTAKPVLETLASYPITTMCAPPTLYRSLLQEDLKKYKISSLRHCCSAGEPLNEEVIYNWEEALGIVIKEGYGQTETTLLCGTFKKMNKWMKPGSMGKPAPGYDVRVVNNMGVEVPRGEQGNLAVKVKPDYPPGLFKGYMNDTEGTSYAFIGDYYLTGDRARQDEDGYLWFESRTDDLIISSGYRIGPFEVESALLEHPSVSESAVVSSPDVTRGQVVKAFVVLSKPYQHVKGDKEKESELKEKLQQHVKNITAPYKYPRKIEFVTSLPKTVSGKIRRTELRERELLKH